MRHYGLKRKTDGRWIHVQKGVLFWTTSPFVAEEQRKIISHPDEYEVAMFPYVDFNASGLPALPEDAKS